MTRRITLSRKTTSTTAFTSHNEHATFSNKLIKVRQNHGNLLRTLTIVLGSEDFIRRVKIFIYNFGFQIPMGQSLSKVIRVGLGILPSDRRLGLLHGKFNKSQV